MAVSWTPHRFSGGALALDVANTVVLRNDPERVFDRFDETAEIVRFAEAATVHRKREIGGRTLSVDIADTRRKVLAIRDATDRLFREAAPGSRLDVACLPPF